MASLARNVSVEAAIEQFKDSFDAGFEPLKRKRKGGESKIFHKSKDEQELQRSYNERQLYVFRSLDPKSAGRLVARCAKISVEDSGATQHRLPRLSYITTGAFRILSKYSADSEDSPHSSIKEFGEALTDAVEELGSSKLPFRAKLGRAAVMRTGISFGPSAERYFVGSGFSGDARHRILQEREEVVSKLGVDNHPLANLYLPHISLFSTSSEEQASLIRDEINNTEIPYSYVELGSIVVAKQKAL